jgi:hypothetical protein
MPSDPPFHPSLTTNCRGVDRAACAGPCLPVNGFPGCPLWCGLFGRISSLRLQKPLAPTFCPLFAFATANILRPRPRRVRKRSPKTASQANLQATTPRDPRAYISSFVARPALLCRAPRFGRANLRLAPSDQGSHRQTLAPAGSSCWISEPVAYRTSVP